MSYAAAAAASAQVNAQIVPAAAGMSDLLGGLGWLSRTATFRTRAVPLDRVAAVRAGPATRVSRSDDRGRSSEAYSERDERTTVDGARPVGKARNPDGGVLNAKRANTRGCRLGARLNGRQWRPSD